LGVELLSCISTPVAPRSTLCPHPKAGTHAWEVVTKPQPPPAGNKESGVRAVTAPRSFHKPLQDLGHILEKARYLWGYRVMT
jgi:hypothetical protein